VAGHQIRFVRTRDASISSAVNWLRSVRRSSVSRRAETAAPRCASGRRRFRAIKIIRGLFLLSLLQNIVANTGSAADVPQTFPTKSNGNGKEFGSTLARPQSARA